MRNWIDLRSDTLTMPDRPMLETVLSARLGDDGRTDARGRGEDAAVNELEDLAAALTGKEAAVLFPSGTMANSAAVMTWCRRGEPVLVEEEQHLLVSERFVFQPEFGGLRPVRYHLDRSHMPDPAELDELLADSGARLLCLENSHNFSGGYCIDLPTMRAIRETADRHGASIHLDGARLFHAAAHLRVPAEQICRYVDSVMFCVSKGLGAPVGSLVCGTAAFCRRVRETRKLLGGGMRQAGVIAAPAIYALEHNIDRLAEDIAHTKLIHGILNGHLGTIRLQEEVQTNILMLDLSETGTGAETFCAQAREKGLLIRPVRDDGKVRLVLYKGITAQDAMAAANVILRLAGETSAERAHLPGGPCRR